MIETTSFAARAAVWLPRGEGQWAMGHREPLNAHERIKRDDHPLNARARISNTTDPAELERFRWCGLTSDGTTFNLRVRVDGGRLTSKQLRVLATLPRVAPVDRGDVELRGVRIEEVPTIWRRLEAVGLSTMESDGDCPVTICGDAHELIAGVVRRFLGRREYANLPHRFESCIGSPCGLPYLTDDLAFVRVANGYEVWVCGERLDATVAPEDVFTVWSAVVFLYRDYGYRRQRAQSRMSFLLQDWGAGLFRKLLQEEYLPRLTLA